MNRPHWRSLAFLAVVAGAIVSVVVPLSFGIASIVTAVALAVWVVVFRAELTAPRLAIRLLFAAALIATAAAVIAPPRSSNDVWSYATYGRIHAHYGMDPYVVPPSAFPDDPFAARVNPRWKDTTPVYGPVFVVVADAFARISGDRPLVARLLYQGLAAACLGAAVALVVRRVRRRTVTAALLLVVAGPLMVVSAVNGGHVDLWLLPLIVGAALAMERELWVRAGALLGVAALVKITVLVVCVGVGVWLLRRRRFGALISLAVATVLIVGVGYLAASRDAWSGLRQNSDLVSRASVWAIPRWLAMSVWDAVIDQQLVAIASVSVVVVTAAVAWFRRAAPSATPADADPMVVLVLIGLATFTGVSAYVLPWYCAAVLVFAAWSADRRWLWFAVVHSSLVFGAHLLPPAASAPVGSAHPAKWVELIAAAAAAATYVWVVRGEFGRARESRAGA